MTLFMLQTCSRWRQHCRNSQLHNSSLTAPKLCAQDGSLHRGVPEHLNLRIIARSKNLPSGPGSIMSVNLSATIHSIYRYPIKGLSPEALESVMLSPGHTLPGDRSYAIENGPSGFDRADPKYFPKAYFLMLMRNERLAALRTRFEDDNHVLTIKENGTEVARGDLKTADGRAAIERFFAVNFTRELKG